MEVEDIAIEKLDIEEPLTDDNKNTQGTVENHDNPTVRRSSRRIRPLVQLEKSQIVTRIRKPNANSSLKDIESYYLDKKVKLICLSLETIFEEPQNSNIMGQRKMRRFIQFSETVGQKPDKIKVKKRSLKAKKILKGGFKRVSKKLGLNILMDKLKGLDEDVDVNVE